MKIDQIKAIFTYVIATFVIVGGLAALVFVEDLDSNTSLVLAGFIGSAMTFVFGSETATRSARQSERASTNGHAKDT